mgnify:CR=1 FL=1
MSDKWVIKDADGNVTNACIKADEAFVTGTFANIIPVKQINTTKFKINNSNLSIKLRNLFISEINKIAPN